MPRAIVEAAKNRLLPMIQGALAAAPIKGRITLSGYEGSELLVARLLVESGADLRYVGTACPRTPYSEADRDWLESRGVMVRFRASLEDDLSAMREFEPGPRHRHDAGGAEAAKERAIPALYFTNLISARPLMGVAGAGSLAKVVNTALGNRHRFDAMRDFFDGRRRRAMPPGSGKRCRKSARTLRVKPRRRPLRRAL